MQETEKIWMNGELVDWADAKIHVASHGLNYGSGVFEGIRCYDTSKGPAVFRLRDHLVRLENSAKVLYMDLPYSIDELRSATHEVDRGERAQLLLPAAGRVLRLRRARRRLDREPDRRGHHQLPVGRLPRRGQPEPRHHREDLELGSGSARTSSRTSRRRPAST